MRSIVHAAALAAALVSAPALADDVSDAILEAKTAYEGGDLSKTKESLDLAAQLVAQKQADGLARLLPEPPAGWTAEAVDTNGGIGSFIGGGLIVKRAYAKGETDVTVQYTANSPLLASLAPLFSNVQLLGGMGKVFRQKGRVAVLTGENEIQMVLGKSYVTVTGSGAEADKRAILDLVDLAAVEAFAK
ncbi:hypothetical protein [Chenggangzhangella methanolivorans]|uniref:Uncharacterized protein n=1 Tax=Chenggangzhangella methanolivorans TaxID=1437009 RepID=A0A9E6UMC8_9HYPH|nr:hypothetical protein [Chenggangzhangella methanolivorans]QZO01547.1 hypothetical protein K6K41_09045 [Chenggangzhangella methanolivorans]